MKKNYDQILGDLIKSQRTGNVISLRLKGNDKLILTSVEQVKGNRMVILNPVSVYGALLEESIVHLEDIENCHVYNSHYHDPVYVRIRELKNSIDQIKKNFGL
jgi:hypothetical protein